MTPVLKSRSRKTDGFHHIRASVLISFHASSTLFTFGVSSVILFSGIRCTTQSSKLNTVAVPMAKVANLTFYMLIGFLQRKMLLNHHNNNNNNNSNNNNNNNNNHSSSSPTSALISCASLRSMVKKTPSGRWAHSTSCKKWCPHQRLQKERGVHKKTAK